MQSYDDAIQKAKKLAQTPEGQQLIELLKQTGGADMEKALDCAASGNFSQIQNILSLLINNPDAKRLLDKMEW